MEEDYVNQAGFSTYVERYQYIRTCLQRRGHKFAVVRLQPFQEMPEEQLSMHTPFPDLPTTPIEVPPTTPQPQVPTTPPGSLPTTPKGVEFLSPLVETTGMPEKSVADSRETARQLGTPNLYHEGNDPREIIAGAVALLVVSIILLFIFYFLSS